MESLKVRFWSQAALKLYLDGFAAGRASCSVIVNNPLYQPPEPDGSYVVELVYDPALDELARLQSH
jgi:hypothetical protein